LRPRNCLTESIPEHRTLAIQRAPRRPNTDVVSHAQLAQLAEKYLPKARGLLTSMMASAFIFIVRARAGHYPAALRTNIARGWQTSRPWLKRTSSKKRRAAQRRRRAISVTCEVNWLLRLGVAPVMILRLVQQNRSILPE